MRIKERTMKKCCIIVVLVVVLFFGCGTENIGEAVKFSGTEMIENLMNNNLIDSDDVSKYINDRNEDSAIIKMFLDYNSNDNSSKDDARKEMNEYSFYSGNDLEFRKRIMILSENL